MSLTSPRETPVKTEYGDAAATSYQRRRRGGRRSGWFTLALIVLVLVAIAVVGDRVAARVATDELRTQLVSEVSQRGVEFDAFDVAIGGFPFLTQVAEGRYEAITIDMTNVRMRTPTNGKVVTVPSLHVVASGVDADTADVVQGTAKVVADQVAGTAVLSFSTLETLVDYSSFSLSNVKFGEADGALQVTGDANLGGGRIPISALADVSATNGALAVKLRNARAVGVDAPQAVTDYLNDIVSRSLAARLPALPFGLTLDDVDVRANGLAISASAREVPLVS